MKHMKKLAVLLLALTMLCGLSLTAYAHEVPGETRTGSITVNMAYNGEAVTGGTLTAYRVGEIMEDDGNYSFGKTEAMAGFAGSYDSLDSENLAKEVAAFVAKNGVSTCTTVANTDGTVVFSSLEMGLYLIIQTEASDGYDAVTPFLVAVPGNEDGIYVYDIDATPKMGTLTEAEPEPEPTTPTTPTGPTLPQTGQLNWPVPVLAVLGLLLMTLGWGLYHSSAGKGRNYAA